MRAEVVDGVVWMNGTSGVLTIPSTLINEGKVVIGKPIRAILLVEE